MEIYTFACRQHSDGAKKVDQAMKDVEYYRQEAENLRSRYNDVILEKQRLEQEVSSLRRYQCYVGHSPVNLVQHSVVVHIGEY